MEEKALVSFQPKELGYPFFKLKVFKFRMYEINDCGEKFSGLEIESYGFKTLIRQEKYSGINPESKGKAVLGGTIE